jgi:Tfp pilus assembly protein PilE
VITVADRRGATFADLVVFLATLSLAAALLYPAWSARGFRDRVATAVADVEAVTTAARRTLQQSGQWPEAAPPGMAPPELAGLSGEGSAFSRTDYRVGWTSWNVVDSVEVVQPPPAPEDTPPETAGRVMAPVSRSVGAVSVHSGDAALLAELTEHFAGEPTFVLDTVWMLVLTDRSTTPVREP